MMAMVKEKGRGAAGQVVLPPPHEGARWNWLSLEAPSAIRYVIFSSLA
jgi:hypothetical protein